MRVRASVACGFVVFSVSAVALAEPMDLALERLVTNPGCRDATGHFQPQGAGPANRCLPDHLAFKRLVNQLGFAFAPSAMHSARTTGYGGIVLAIEANYTKISQDESYWKAGTQGSVDPSTQQAPATNSNPDSLLQLYSIKARKGFGFGLEVAGMFGFMPQTRLLGGGADVRLSLLEGFRRKFLGILPDVAVGGGVRTITGTSELQLTVSSIDAQVSKPLPLADSSVLTPWIGYQHLWIFGDSGLIDLTPATDAQAVCGYGGARVPGNGNPGETVYDGGPICTNGNGSGADFNNNAIFNRARLERHRILVGFNYRYEMLLAGAQFATDLTSPADAQSSEKDAEILDGESRQWTLALELGASF